MTDELNIIDEWIIDNEPVDWDMLLEEIENTEKLISKIKSNQDKILVWMKRSLQSEMEQDLTNLGLYIASKKYEYNTTKDWLDLFMIKEWETVRKDFTSDVWATRKLKKMKMEDTEEIAFLKRRVEMLEWKYNSLIRFAKHIDWLFIQENVDFKRQDWVINSPDNI